MIQQSLTWLLLLFFFFSLTLFVFRHIVSSIQLLNCPGNYTTREWVFNEVREKETWGWRGINNYFCINLVKKLIRATFALLILAMTPILAENFQLRKARALSHTLILILKYSAIRANGSLPMLICAGHRRRKPRVRFVYTIHVKRWPAALSWIIRQLQLSYLSLFFFVKEFQAWLFMIFFFLSGSLSVSLSSVDWTWCFCMVEIILVLTGSLCETSFDDELML